MDSFFLKFNKQLQNNILVEVNIYRKEGDDNFTNSVYVIEEIYEIQNQLLDLINDYENDICYDTTYVYRNNDYSNYSGTIITKGTLLYPFKLTFKKKGFQQDFIFFFTKEHQYINLKNFLMDFV